MNQPLSMVTISLCWLTPRIQPRSWRRSQIPLPTILCVKVPHEMNGELHTAWHTTTLPTWWPNLCHMVKRGLSLLVRCCGGYEVMCFRGGALRMGPEAPMWDDGFSSVFPSGGINHHMFWAGVSGFLQHVIFLSCYWSFKSSPAFIVNRGFWYFHGVRFARQPKSNHIQLVWGEIFGAK